MDQQRKTTEPILRIAATVKEDVANYRGNVQKFLDGETSAVAFRGYRVPMGIYEQREEGHFMVRTRIGAGLVTAEQLRQIARLSTEYGNGILHITTRQDIQIHDVNIEMTPDVLEQLMDTHIAARGGGGNTVRNVSACAGSGICPNEKFEVAPYAIAVAEYLLQDRSSFNLPRKYKIVFTGCSNDCGLASVADLGFFTKLKDGEKGFEVYAGGGLGSSPNVAIKIEDFIKDSEVFEVAEAIKRLFDKHGDRSNKNKARLRYVLKRVGDEEFIKMYKAERAVIADEGLKGDIPEIRDIFAPFRVEGTETGEEASSLPIGVLPEKTPGVNTLRITLNLGDITAEELTVVADIAEEYGSGLVRTTQLQNILISGINHDDVDTVLEKLKTNIKSIAPQSPQLVACTGAATCKLGLCLSRGLASAIADTVGEVESTTMPPMIRISGCPNSCGHHSIASIGFQGRAKRINGRLMPCYDVMIGAVIKQGKAKLAEKIGTVPAKRIPEMMKQVLANGAEDIEKLKELTAQYDDFSVEFPDDYFYDFGADVPFSLAGRGAGECGAGVMDVITVDIDEARHAITQAAALTDSKQKSDFLCKAVVAAARALLVTFGLEPKKDREIFTGFAEHLIKPGWVSTDTQQLLDKIIDYRLGDIDSITDLFDEAKDMVARINELFKSLDASLKFKVEPITQIQNDQQETANQFVDLRGVTCPINFVKAKLKLEQVEVGQVLEILLDDGAPVKNVPASFAEQGQEVLSVEPVENHFSVKVQRKK